MTRTPLSVIAVAVAVAAAMLGGQAQAASSPAMERTESFIAAFKKVKSGDKLTPADKKANEAAFTSLDKFMDWDTLTTKPIEPRAAKFSAGQKKDFASKFKDVVRRMAYPDSGSFFRDAKLKFGEATEKGGATVVPIDAHVPKDDLRTKIELYWSKKDGTLKLVDVAFDGDSLIKDYQNQFARIVDKEGVSGLMKKVDEKRAELDKGVRAKDTAAK
jgi:phospholipid transport system substrate-binding protein